MITPGMLPMPPMMMIVNGADREIEDEVGRRDRRDLRGKDRAAETADCGADAEGEQFVVDRVDAHRRGHILILTDRLPGAARSRIAQPLGNKGSAEAAGRARDRRAAPAAGW